MATHTRRPFRRRSAAPPLGGEPARSAGCTANVARSSAGPHWAAKRRFHSTSPACRKLRAASSREMSVNASGCRRPSMDGGRRLSMDLTTSDELIKPAWSAFLDAGEVCTYTHSRSRRPPGGRSSSSWSSRPSRPSRPSRRSPVPQVLDAVSSYHALRLACGVPDDAYGRPAFDKVLQATLVSQAAYTPDPNSDVRSRAPAARHHPEPR